MNIKCMYEVILNTVVPVLQYDCDEWLPFLKENQAQKYVNRSQKIK
jgi:hypothetical protein